MQGPGPLREVDQVVVEVAPVEEGPFFNFLNPLNVIIPPTDYADHRLISDLIAELF